MGVQQQVVELRRKTEALEKVVVGQTAMIAMLCSMMAKSNVITPVEARLVVMAGTDAQGYEGLAPDKIRDWAVSNLESMLKGKMEEQGGVGLQDGSRPGHKPG